MTGSYLLVSYQEAVGMFVFTSNFIVGDQIHQLTDKAHHFFVPGHVGHGKTACRTLSTVGNTLWKHYNSQRQLQTYLNVTEEELQSQKGFYRSTNPSQAKPIHIFK